MDFKEMLAKEGKISSKNSKIFFGLKNYLFYL